MHAVSTAPAPIDIVLESTKPALSKRWSPIAWVLALALIHGCLYVAIVPPWQVPDENVHYEYLRGLSQTASLFPFVVVRSPEIFQQVRASARVFRWWEFFRLPTPPGNPPSLSLCS